MEAFQLPHGRRQVDPSTEPLPPWFGTTAPHCQPTQVRSVALQSTAKAFCAAGTIRLGLPTARAALAASLASVVAACARPHFRHLSACRSDQHTNSSSRNSSSSQTSSNVSHVAPDSSNQHSTRLCHPTCLGPHLMSNSPQYRPNSLTRTALKSGCLFQTPTART